MRSLSQRLVRSAAAAGVAVLALAPSGASATPIGNVYEGAGYAVAVGPGGKASACVSTAEYLPAESVHVTTAPVGASMTVTAMATAACVGTLPVEQGLVIEVGNANHYLSKNCGAATTCSLVIPAGWGQFRIMPSAFWTIQDNATWTLVNPVNNDGYCDTSSGGTETVCRAWATGIS